MREVSAGVGVWERTEGRQGPGSRSPSITKEIGSIPVFEAWACLCWDHGSGGTIDR